LADECRIAAHVVGQRRLLGSFRQAQARLRKTLEALPRTEITQEEPGYLAVSFRSRIFGFVDEAEFACDDAGRR
jgi:uncharacterized protein (DUF1499 family)